MQLNIHKKNVIWCQSRFWSKLTRQVCISTYFLNFQINHAYYPASGRLVYKNNINMVHQSIIIMKYTHLCPFNEHLKPCYGK